MPRAILLLFCACVSLTACGLAPDYHRPLVNLPATYKEVGPWRPATPEDAAPRGTWWDQFGDATLNRLEPQLEAANPDFAAAVARYDQARALAAAAQAGLMPQIDLGGSLSTNKQSTTRPLRGATQPNYYGSNQLAASAGYEIDFWGKIRNEAHAGTELAQASAADLATMRLSLQSELANDYLSLRGVDADVRLLTDTIAAYQKALDLTEMLFRGKIVSSLDVSRAQIQLDSAKAQLSEVTSKRALLEHAVATLVGQPAGSFTLSAEVSPFVLPEIPVSVPAALLQRRPDIAAAERKAAAANAEIGVARAAFYPAVSLNLLGGTQSSGFNLLSLPNSFWTLGPDVTLPLFDGGKLSAQEAAAYARFREAGADYRSTVLSAFQDIEDNLALLHWLGQEARDEAAGVTAAQHALDVALNLYQQGIASYLEVVTAQTALLQAQQTELDLQTRRLQADIGLIRGLGGGWTAADLPSDQQAATLPTQKINSVSSQSVAGFHAN